MRFLSGTALLLFSFGINAAVLTTPTPSVKVYAIDNQPVEELSEHTLAKGKHQLVVSYTDILKTGSRTELFSSKPYILEFELAKDVDMVLSIPHFSRLNQAERFFRGKSPEWRLKQNGENVPYEMTLLPPNSGFMPYGDIPALIREYNNSVGNEFAAGTLSNIKEKAVQVTETGDVVLNNDPIVQLKMWYLQANKAERKEFRKWMIDQE